LTVAHQNETFLSFRQFANFLTKCSEEQPECAVSKSHKHKKIKEIKLKNVLFIDVFGTKVLIVTQPHFSQEWTNMGAPKQWTPFWMACSNLCNYKPVILSEKLLRFLVK
jgi:hypothetical protein